MIYPSIETSQENGRKAARAVIADQLEIWPLRSIEAVREARARVDLEVERSGAASLRADGVREDHIEAWKQGFVEVMTTAIDTSEKALTPGGRTVLHK